MKVTQDEFRAILASMNERQLDYFMRLSQRLLADPGFAERLDREGVIFSDLLRTENYRALDRWFMRGQLRLVNHGMEGRQ